MLAVAPISFGAPPLGTGSTSGLTAEEAAVLNGFDFENAWYQLDLISSWGEKVAGSEAERMGQQYVSDQFSGMPVDEVWWEEFPVNFWDHSGTTLKIVSNGYEDIPAVTYGDCYSIWGSEDYVPYFFGNENEGKTLVAEVVDAGLGTAADFAALGMLDGAIALVHRDDNVQGWLNPVIYEAEQWGASAVITYGYYAGADNPEGIKQDSVGGPLPGISISPNSAFHIQELMESGPVTLQIDGQVDILSEAYAESVNVAAVMWGETKREEYIVISGHIDTWWYGANDDSSSIAAVLELARLFSEARENGLYVNDRTLIFCSVGAEEQGGPGGTWYNWLVGSYEFVIAHPEIMAGLVVEINMDGVSLKRTTGRFWLEQTWEINSFVSGSIKDLGMTGLVTYYNPLWSWTDAWSFGAKGGGSAVELIGWIEGYDWTYHTQLDDMDIQSIDTLSTVLKLDALMAIRADKALIMPMELQNTCDWAMGYLTAEKTTVPGAADEIDAAIEALETLREKIVEVNAYADYVEATYAAAETPEDKAAAQLMADELNRVLIDARRIITCWTLGEGGTMGSWDVFLRSDQHAHDFGAVHSALTWLSRNRVPNAILALETVYTMEWGKHFSPGPYETIFDEMVNAYMYWGDDFDQQQGYVDVHGVYLGLKDGSMTRAEAIAELKLIRDNQLMPWFVEDIMTLEWAWTEATMILDAGLP